MALYTVETPPRPKKMDIGAASHGHIESLYGKLKGNVGCLFVACDTLLLEHTIYPRRYEPAVRISDMAETNQQTRSARNYRHHPSYRH